jgi:hypothetical protein
MVGVWIKALLACALGVALGLLSDGARAANDGMPMPPARPVDGEAWTLALEVCEHIGVNLHVCAMKNAPTEAMALQTAKIVLAHCAKTPEQAFYCDPAVAYIKQRWGY